MIKTDAGRFRFEEKDVRMKRGFCNAMDSTRGCRIGMDVLLDAMGRAERNLHVAWANVKSDLSKEVR